MKRLILFELMLLFLATTFESDSPSGWFQQTLPRTDITVQDIYFIDSLMGYCVVRKNTNDSAFIYKTSDGGNNWAISIGENIYLTTIQFVDNNTGYSVGSGGGGGIIKKTINGGVNWYTSALVSGFPLTDVFFADVNTGWTCSEDIFGAGLLKTTNGGINRQSQLGASFKPTKLFFLNKDTGWVGTNEPNGRLFRTTNSGVNWDLQYTTNIAITSIFFLNSSNGWIRGGNTVGTMYSTNGGFNWTNAQGNVASGYDIKFVNDSIGYSGGGLQKVAKSTDGGKNWGYQNIPIFDASQTYMFRNNTSLGWMGSNGMIKTTDGGGPIIYSGIGINPNSGVIPSFNLKQNYPNPFNPSTNITFDVTRNSKISLKIFNMLGEEIDELIDYEDHNTGTFTVNYETHDDMPSGVYFYQITAWTENKKEIFIDTKKMILIK